MTHTVLPGGPVRTSLVVLSERRPEPSRPRRPIEAAIERALREHHGIWVTLPAKKDMPAEDAESEPLAFPWGPLDHDPQPLNSLAEWSRYSRANTAYGEHTLDLVTVDGAVWINGNAWLLVATVLRSAGHRGPIGLLLDRPFPSRARFDTLPWRDEVMTSLCRLDLLGFSTPQCADNFAAGAPGSRDLPSLDVFPVGTAAAVAPVGPSFLEHLAHARRRRFVDRPA